LIARAPGEKATSRKIFVIVNTPKKVDAADANLTLRGVTPDAAARRSGLISAGGGVPCRLQRAVRFDDGLKSFAKRLHRIAWS
jgi:hypothetical protein